MTQWNPDMSAAPKDGKQVLGFSSYNKKTIVGYVDANGHFLSIPGQWIYPVSHWQPLPDPPSGEA